MPSAKLTGIKTADPFSTKATFKINSFAYVYNAGGIPCRIDHGSITNKLKWDSSVILSGITLSHPTCLHISILNMHLTHL
jgi:hypothetical protein